MENTKYLYEIVADNFGIPSDKILDKTRKREIVQARQTYHYFLKRLGYGVSGIGIGTLKDHATAIHSIKTVNNLLETDKDFQIMYLKAEQELENTLKHGTVLVPNVIDVEEYESVDSIEYIPYQSLKKNSYLINFPIFKTLNPVDFIKLAIENEAHREISKAMKDRAVEVKEASMGVVTTMLPIEMTGKYYIIHLVVDETSLNEGCVGMISVYETSMDGFLDRMSADKDDVQFASVNIQK